ncbi:MAG: thiolase family protein [Elusimicrobia bacterium]|nr:thiolase family protein [Elusimicrobiota bacterium]
MTLNDRDPVVVSAVRTPIGRLGGLLAPLRPDDLAAEVIRAAVAKSKADPEEIADVYFGCANQAGEDNRNVARMAALLAGLPQSVPGCTLNRLCASGLEAVNSAARAIIAGEGEVYVAGGVESMSRAPWALPKADKAFPFGNLTAYDTALGWRFPNPRLAKMFPLSQMGETAENVAERYKISREDQDAFALESHRRASAAQEGAFKDEILPVMVPQKKGPVAPVMRDESPRGDTSLEKLAALAAAFRKGGTVTAGNSSSLNDGAAALVLMTARRAKALGVEPLAKWGGSASAGVDPSYMGLGPVYSTKKLLARLELNAKDFDVVELNEAFAAQVLACARELAWDPAKLNAQGGAIALGHPLGMSGARLAVTAVHQLKRRGAGRALATLCVGVGQGLSTVFEGI